MTKPTPHLKRVSKNDLPDDMKQSWDQANDLTGDATFVEVSGNNPDVYRWYLDEFYQKLFYSDRLETTLVELVRLRLANVHGCAFCNKGDTAHALQSGISQEQIDSLEDYMNGPFSDRQKSALMLADQMVLTNESQTIEDHKADTVREFSKTFGQFPSAMRSKSVVSPIGKKTKKKKGKSSS